MSGIHELRQQGAIGGRTAQIIESGEVECASYETAPLPAGWVQIQTHESVVSAGTESTFRGKDASNVFLHRAWNTDLRLFQSGTPSHQYPVTFGYRAAGTVVESTDQRVSLGDRVWGNWRHTEFVAMPAEQAKAQTIPPGMTWEDAVDIGQMAPICLNAVLFGEGDQDGAPVVVYGAGPVGLLTAQAVRALGAGPIYVVDRLLSRLQIAAAQGFEPLDATADDIPAALKAEHGADGFPVVWECTGSTRALHQAIRVVRRLGTVVAVGFYQGDADGLRLGEEFHHNGVRILSGQIGNTHPSTSRAGLQKMALEMVVSGSMSPASLPRARFRVEEVASAMAMVDRPDEVLQVSLSYGT